MIFGFFVANLLFPIGAYYHNLSNRSQYFKFLWLFVAVVPARVCYPGPWWKRDDPFLILIDEQGKDIRSAAALLRFSTTELTQDAHPFGSMHAMDFLQLKRRKPLPVQRFSVHSGTHPFLLMEIPRYMIRSREIQTLRNFRNGPRRLRQHLCDPF